MALSSRALIYALGSSQSYGISITRNTASAAGKSPISDGAIAGKLATAPAQNSHMDMLDFREALQQLPPDQREALILIGGSGLSYEEAASVCRCAVGTMKSRVNRARSRLAELLSITSSSQFGDDGDWQAVDPVFVGQRYSRGGSE